MTIVSAVVGQARSSEPEPNLNPLLDHTARLIREFQFDWRLETPEQIHGSSFDHDGIPDWHPDFLAYIERTCKKPGCTDLNCRHGMKTLHPDSRVRVTRAFRRLRKEAPREFDALYLITRHNLTLREISDSLNDRAVRIGAPQRYTREGILVLVISAAHKIEQWS